MFKKLYIPILMLWMTSLFAQTTGKIMGIVTDKASGNNLAGVNVVVENTNLGSATDEDGFYSILNVPVGEYDVKVIYVGYKETVIKGIRVSVGLTTEINFEMETTTLELEQPIVITAGRDLMRKDETNTSIISRAEDIAVLPVRGIEAIAALTAGVVKQDNSNNMNIRGGRDTESAVYVDGVLVNDPYNKAVRVYLPNEAIEEMSIQTGGFNAEYGEAMSGIIITTTKSGTKKYTGSVEVITDNFLSVYNKEFGLGTYSYGYNEYVVSLSGPIYPGMAHTFFFSGTRIWAQDHTPSWGWAENKNKPAQFKAATIPANSDDKWSFAGKLKFQLMNNLELKSSVVWTDRTYAGSGDWNTMNTLFLYDTQHAPELLTQHRSFNATLSHNINPSTFYDLKYNYFYTLRKNYDRHFKDELMKYGDPRYNPLNANDLQSWGQFYQDPNNMEPDFFGPGTQHNDYFRNKTTYWGIDFDIVHQYDKNHTFKAGMEYKYHTLREIRILDPVQLANRSVETLIERYRGADVRFYGYELQYNEQDGTFKIKETDNGEYFNVVRDSTGSPISGFNKEAPYHPILMSAYLQDKIEFGDMILNLGLRYDRIDPNAWQFKELEARYDANDEYIEGSGMFGGDETFNRDDIEDSKAYEFFSPRLGISFPVAENTVFYAQYGKFYQSPALLDLYLSPFYLDAFVNRGGYFTLLDNPNLKPPKTTSYEIGFKKGLSVYAVLRLTAFYKETEDLVQAIPIQTDVTNIAFMNNGDFGVIKGFDIMFTLNRYKNFMINFNYELQYATGTGSAYDDNFDIAWQQAGRGHYPKFTMPLDFEQRHTGSINIDYRLGEGEGPSISNIKPLENFGINFLYTFNSGNPYTRMYIHNTMPHAGRYDPDGLSQTPVSAVNSEKTPWNNRLDLKIDRRFKLPLYNSTLVIYAVVFNLLNTNNVQNVWITTGLGNDTGYLSTPSGKEYWESITEEEKKSYSLREMDYSYYGMPRQIRLGLRLEF
jgi:outer membrane receptor protein involved in Fe transport